MLKFSSSGFLYQIKISDCQARFFMIIYILRADMAELADALDSGSSEGFLMQVQVLLSA